jgi:hypothetical protein
MTWTVVTESSNTWDLVDYKNYVLEGYWADGYAVQDIQQWTQPSESGNNWIMVNNSSNTWTETSESSNNWVVIG